MTTEAGRRLLDWYDDHPDDHRPTLRGFASSIAAIEAEARAALPEGWCGHEVSCCEFACYEDPGCQCDGCKAEDDLVRLRRIEAAARELVDNWPWGAQHIVPPTALRAALEERA